VPRSPRHLGGVHMGILEHVSWGNGERLPVTNRIAVVVAEAAAEAVVPLWPLWRLAVAGISCVCAWAWNPPSTGRWRQGRPKGEARTKQTSSRLEHATSPPPSARPASRRRHLAAWGWAPGAAAASGAPETVPQRPRSCRRPKALPAARSSHADADNTEADAGPSGCPPLVSVPLLVALPLRARAKCSMAHRGFRSAAGS